MGPLNVNEKRGGMVARCVLSTLVLLIAAVAPTAYGFSAGVQLALRRHASM